MGKLTYIRKPISECRSIGDFIKYARESHGLSQIELAEATGICSSTIAKWEVDLIVPGVYNLITVANVLDMSLDELVGRRRGRKNNIERNDKKR